MEDLSFGQVIWTVVVSGLLGTLAMTAVLIRITKAGWANADMVRAIGSLLTKEYESSFPVGLLIHAVVGVIIALIYVFGLNTVSVSGVITSAAVGLMFGFFHGVAVSLLLVVAVAEHHPLEQFQKAGFSVAAAHLAGHLVYGLVVGFVAGSMLF